VHSARARARERERKKEKKKRYLILSIIYFDSLLYCYLLIFEGEKKIEKNRKK